MSPAADIDCADWALAGPTLLRRGAIFPPLFLASGIAEGLTRLAISVSLASVSFSHFSVLARSSASSSCAVLWPNFERNHRWQFRSALPFARRQARRRP